MPYNQFVLQRKTITAPQNPKRRFCQFFRLQLYGAKKGVLRPPPIVRQMPHLSCKRPPPPTACRDGEGCPVGRQKNILCRKAPTDSTGLICSSVAILSEVRFFVFQRRGGGDSTFRRHLSLPPPLSRRLRPRSQGAMPSVAREGREGTCPQGLSWGGKKFSCPTLPLRIPAGRERAFRGKRRRGGCYSLRKKKLFQAMAFARK